MKKYLKILRRCPLFVDISDDNILKIITCLDARIEYFDNKYTVMNSSGSAKYLGIVLSGSVNMIQTDFQGNRSIFCIFKSSELFAEDYSCAENPELPVSFIANEPCSIMLIRTSHILKTCKTNCAFHQQMIYNLMKNLAKKVLIFHQKFDITSKRTTRQRLLTYLLHQANLNGSKEFDIPFKRQELADYLEVDRSGLSVEINKLCKEGVIENSRSHFKIIV